MVAGNLVHKLRSLMGGNAERVALTAKGVEQLRGQLRECAEGLGGEVSARGRAARLAESYLRLNDEGRQRFLKLIALEFGPDPKKVEKAHAAYQKAVGTAEQWKAEAALRGAMRSSRIRILTQFNAIPQGVKFLVDLRADLLRYLEQDKELAVLDRELESRLSAWFDVGFLELQRITWHSPAALLEKLIEYEAVHEIRSWADLKNRLDSDRRLYAFFHPRMPAEPLIFVEVALTDHLADNVQALLDEHAPVFDNRKADTAIFYSISNTQVGLRGVSFGNFLLKRVIDDLQRDFPSWPISPPCRRCPAWRPGCARTRRCWARPASNCRWKHCRPAPGRPTRNRREPCANPCPASPHVTWPAPSRAAARAGRRPTRCPASTSATARASSGSTTWATVRPRVSASPSG
jgi:malonyl-CoA decarboxylase